MSEFIPDITSLQAVRQLLSTMIERFPYMFRIDEIVPNCEIIDVDPAAVGVGVTPRYVTVRVYRYYQDVLFRGGFTISVGDYVNVLYMREGDRYEILGIAGSAGAWSLDLDDLNDVNAPAPNDGDVLTWDAYSNWWEPAPVSGGGGGGVQFDSADILLNLTFDHWFFDDSLYEDPRVVFLTSRYGKAKLGASTDYFGRSSFRLCPSLWAFRRAMPCDTYNTNHVTNPSFELNLANWVEINTTRIRTDEHAKWQNWSLRFTATAQWARVHYAFTHTTPYAYSVYVKADSPLVRLDVYDVTGAVSLGTDSHPGDGQWHRLIVPNAVPTGAPSVVQMRIEDGRAANWTAIYVDGAQIDNRIVESAYIDGDQGDGYFWNGAPHASDSDRVSGSIELDDMVSAFEGNDTFSVRAIVQMPYDADADWPWSTAYVWDFRGANDNNRVYLFFDEATNTFQVYINGAVRLTSSAQTFNRGDWLDIILTCDFGLYDEYVLYINNTLEDSDTTALNAPTGLLDWRLGSRYDGSPSVSGFAFAEHTVFDRVLTISEVTSILWDPIVDPLNSLPDRTTPAPAMGYLPFALEAWSTNSGSYVELEGTDYSRQLLGYYWYAGKVSLQFIGYVSAGTGYVKLQYYEQWNGAWYDVIGSTVAFTNGAYDRMVSGVLTIPNPQFEYRAMAMNVGGGTTYLRRVELLVPPGADGGL